MKIKINDIRTDGGTQSRAAINDETVTDYAEALDGGAEFPQIVVVFDGSAYWLADGFHRHAAYARAGRAEIPALVLQGTRRDAILKSVGANAAHGLRRTNDDKRRAVTVLLTDSEWSAWSNREIARQCCVSDVFVAKVRADLSANGLQMPTERTVERGGKVYTQDTTKIGKAKGGDRVKTPAEPKEPAAPASLGDGARQEAASATAAPADSPTDPHAAARKGLSSLTREGLEDEVIGLREAVADEKAKRKKAEAERDDFKSKWQEALAGDDMGRALGNAQRQRDTAKGRLDEELAKNARQGRRIKVLEAEIAKLTRARENEIVEL
ncbi:ParB N-terminal domain-containing protein [Roseibacterium sp. SDUM158017]|uniref:ParB N-terminal domain-containing protein n=1 Tax=Roseicyclus salinarum TaxID=3036773 RepID=UPI002415805B|nr:ParB N-terminal domain-containing protein [Roseibacterium sp. SDUM158017]MDG4650096.1 ParB N-terminal domain-containing protein [Roseibacterium sp. SDUM158017]